MSPGAVISTTSVCLFPARRTSLVRDWSRCEHPAGGKSQGGRMASRRRLVAVVGGLTALVGGVVSAQAAPVSVHPKSVQVSRGDVTIVRTSVSGGAEIDYQVAFTGRLAVHGWTYTGTLQGTSVARSSWETFPGSGIPAFDVASPDGVVTGARGGGPDDPVDDTTGVAVSDRINRHGYSFTCDLSHDGGARWQVSIDTTSKLQQVDADTTRFTGTYRIVDVRTTVVGIAKNVTYGDVQLGVYSDTGWGQQLGPLQFSGQVVIGTARYVGDLVSAVAPYAPTSAITDLPISGTSAGHSVTGTCSGDINALLFLAVGTAYDLTCDLSLDDGPVVSVPLRAFITGGGGRCSGRECWRDDTGYFTHRTG